MNAYNHWCPVLLDDTDTPSGETPSPALQCARNVYHAVDCRMPEAAALAGWLMENAIAFGLPESAVPDYEASGRRRRRGVGATDWEKVGTALEEAASNLPDDGKDTIDCWVAALKDRVALDALEARILALALRYRLDGRVERLCDAISESRGRPTRFRRDAGLIGLLLAASRSAVASRLTGEAKLLASGVLYIESDAKLAPLERLISLIRRDEPPAADIYDQLLGATTTAPLSWDAFAHLGQEAEVAAKVL